MDAVDEQILQCLMIDGRASMRQIGEVVGVSEQTASRRYRALVETGVARVLVSESALAAGRGLWLLRLRCRPDASARLGQVLAARSDVSWVAAHSGGSELICTTTLPVDTACGGGLLPQLSTTTAVLSFEAYSVLHSYSGGLMEWSAFEHPLPPEGRAALLDGRARTLSSSSNAAAPVVSAEDRPLLDALGADGRASVSRLARELDWPTSRVTTHLRALLETGAVDVDVDVMLELLGYRASATLLIQVAPNRIRAVGEALSQHPQTSWVAAVTGSANIVAAVTCRDSRQLFEYVTDGVGGLAGIIHTEILPILTRLKQAETRVIDGRLERNPTRH